MAEGITLEGQLSNRWVANNINVYLNNLLKTNKDFVITMDTDSCIVSLEDLVTKVCPKDYKNEKVVGFVSKLIESKIQPEVDNFCQRLNDYVNSYKNALSYKLEKICSSGVFVAKKRYALNVYSNEGVVYSSPKIKVTGLEIVKSSTPTLVRKALKDCLEIVLNGDSNQLQEYLSKFKQTFLDSSVESISFPRGVNGLSKYFDASSVYKKGTPIHVRGSIVYNNLIDSLSLGSEFEYIKDGDKIKYCYLKVPNKVKENIIAFPEKLPKQFDLLDCIDYNLMWEKVFIEPLKSITDIIGWELEKRNSLEDFF